MRRNITGRDLLITIAIFFMALAVRVINLGQFLTTDEPEGWLGKSMDFIQAILVGNLGETFLHYSPGVTLMWSGSLGLFLSYIFNPGSSPDFFNFLQTVPFDPIAPSIIFWIRLPNVFIGAACIGLAYPFAKGLLGFKTALTGCLLLMLDPLVIGMNRILGHDGLVAALMMISTLSAISYFVNVDNRDTTWRLVLSGIFAGLAVLAKSTAFFLVPFVGFMVLTMAVTHRRGIKPLARDTLIWIGTALLTFILLWPALWVDPLGTVQRMVEGLSSAAAEPHNRGSFFWGEAVPDPGLGFYWVATYFRLTMITTGGLILAGLYMLYAIYNRRILSRRVAQSPRESDRLNQNGFSTQTVMVLFLLWAFVLFYIIFLSFGSKKQDRYIVPVLPVVSFIAALGYVWITQHIHKAVWQNLILAAVVGLQGLIMFNSYPYFLSHYNLLAGGNRAAPNTLLIGWGEGLDRAAAYLNALPEAETLKVSSWYHSAFEPYFAGQAVETAGDEKISRSPKPALASDYVVLYINQIQRQMPTPGMIQFFRSFPVEQVISIDGIDYAYIYPSPAVSHLFSGEVRLVGQAELLGYKLLDDNGRPLSAIPADYSPTLQLYWEWQGKAKEEPINLSLVDINGEEWGLGNSLGSHSPFTYENWQEGAIVRDDFQLSIYPGTPPGDYFLKIRIDRPATDEVVGVFPVALDEARLTVNPPTSPVLPTDLRLTRKLDQSIAEGITLVGYDDKNQFDEAWQPAETRRLLLYWSGNQNIAPDLPLTMALAGSDHVIRAQWFGPPLNDRYPPDQWVPGAVIRAPWTLTLPAAVPPGEYNLTVSLGESKPVVLRSISVAGRPRQFDPPPLNLTLDAGFGDTIQLLGLQSEAVSDQSGLEITPGQPLSFKLVWFTSDLVEADYTVTAQLLDGRQQVISQRDQMPLAGSAPTSSWAVGEVVVDDVSLDIPAELGPSSYQLLLALYHFETGARLPLPDGADHLVIPVTLR